MTEIKLNVTDRKVVKSNVFVAFCMKFVKKRQQWSWLLQIDFIYYDSV